MHRSSILLCLCFFCAVFSHAQITSLERKASDALRKSIVNKKSTDSILCIVVADGKGEMSKYGIEKFNTSQNVFVLKLPLQKLSLLIADSSVRFADLYTVPKEELTTGVLDLATNKANTAHHKYPLIRGDSIVVSVKENKLDTTDIDFINRYRYSSPSSSLVTAHASVMATTIAGGGNSSVYAKGVAYAALITSANFASLIPESDAVYAGQNITIQNHSYGTINQNYYGAEALAYDQNAVANPTLLHVFSAGNIGNTAGTTGAYTGITGVANLTGNFKMSKNTIAVGAIDSFYSVSLLSSKGPAYDGRIKPELVAFGEDGSSGAAAMTSGAAALIQQAYKISKGKIPSSALTKAVLINSADDLATPGPDFSSGFGSLNVYNGVKTIVDGKYFEDAIGNGQVKNFSLSIPPNTNNLKVTLVWTDLPAQVNAAKALVNDLNIIIKNNITGTDWKPWVLNAKPNKDSLALAAVRGIDTLNNVEQILIQNPLAGTYLIEVKGSSVIGPAQSFSIAYQVDSIDHFEWTYPTGSDPLLSGKQNIIRWQTTRTGVGVVEWTTDGTAWINLGEVDDIKTGFFKWSAPDIITKALFRMKFATSDYVSDTTVLSKPLSIKTAFNCADSFMLYWNNVGVTYQLYQLSGNYMQPFKVVTDTFIVLSKSAHPSLYYSVAPVVKGKTGLRSATLNYKGQGVDCYFRSFFLQNQNGSSASFVATLGTVIGVQSVGFQKLQKIVYNTIINRSNPSITDFTFKDDSLSRGVNRFRLMITLNSGQVIFSDPIDVYYFPDAEVIIYPNPVKQNTPLNIITSKGGQVDLRIFNSTGGLVKEIKLKDLYQQYPTFTLPAGVYMIKINTREGSVSTQKLVVY